MATALQKQLATIAAASTHQLDLRAQKSAHGKSLLFEPRVAASQSFENVYLLCLDGFRDLCALDGRFRPFAQSLFSEQSKVEDRAHMTRDENTQLDTVLEAFITLVGPRLLLKPAEKALEWLVRRFRVHEYNTECLVFTYLPYHNTPQFLALLSILSTHPPQALRFLFPYIQAPTSPPRRTIAYTAINTPVFFNAYQAYITKVVKAGHQAPQLLSFWSSITVEAIFGMLSNSSTGRRDVQDQKTEELVLQVLPVLNSCMRAKSGADTVTACYTIVIILVNQAKLGNNVLDGLMEAVVLAHDQSSLLECLACLAIIAGERSEAQIPVTVHRTLLRIPQLSEKLHTLSKQCQTERLTLGCALGALSGATRSSVKRTVLQELLTANILTESRTRIVLSALITLLRDSEPGSEDHGELLALTTTLTESDQLSSILKSSAKQVEVDLDALGITLDQSVEVDQIDPIDSEDEDMLDADKTLPTPEDYQSQLPTITTTSYLAPDANDVFEQTADVFERAVSAKQTKRFLALEELHRSEPVQKTLYLSLLVRIWSSQSSIAVRVAALRALIPVISEVDHVYSLQHLLPYLVNALGDPSPLVRRAAAACVAAMSGKTFTSLKTLWGKSDLYGKTSSQLLTLSEDDMVTLITSMLKPILEECVMDAKFVVPALRELLEGSQTSKNLPKSAFKAQIRTTILSFFASHVSSTPDLRVRLALLPLFNFVGKTSDVVRSNTIHPLLRQWCSLSSTAAISACQREDLAIEEAERAHVNALMPKEAKSVQLLQDIMTGTVNTQRTILASAAFNRTGSSWSAFKSDSRLSLALCLLDLSLNEKADSYSKFSRDRAIELLRELKLDSAALLAFLDSVPTAVHMPDGPPSKKRRRTSRNEMARVELSSQDDVQRLLRRLTLVLEIIEGAEPGQHPALFKSLFGVFGELQPLKQQSGSELVYLQSMILGSLTPIVHTLKNQSDTVEYQSAVRADLLIDCIRHSTSPQVQNSALLLIANLASWVPDLILHNLMPIFTFIGSTLLRQQDDYSAQVVDKTISRVVPQLAASLRAKHKNFLTGVSDLLLSFTAAFEHIPSHRRLKLFSELARTLGPEDSLSAIIALLADRHQNNKSHRRFSTDLLLVFDPIHTLDVSSRTIPLPMAG